MMAATVDKARTPDMAYAEALTQRAGLRFTRIRKFVYQCLLDAKQPIGAYDIIEMIGRVGSAKPPTVYRALEWLIESGLATKIATTSKYAPLPTNTNENSTAFFLCRNCGSATSLIEACKLNCVNPQSWLTYGLAKIQETKLSGFIKVLPWNHDEAKN